MSHSEKPSTEEFVLAEAYPAATAPETVSAKVRVDIAAWSDLGCVRLNNEDHYIVVRFQRVLQTILSNLPQGLVPPRSEEAGYGMAVADGLGGGAAGEIASQTALRTLVNLALHTPDWMMRPGDGTADEVMERMAERFHQADDFLKEQARIDPGLTGMGTTLTVACSLAHELILAHVGDSRVYLFRRGELRQLTRDHTLVQALVEEGRLTPDEGATHRLRHVLTQALGAGDWVEAEVQRFMLIHEDQLLLCTDGLTGMVDNAGIAAILQSSATSEEACHALVDLAKKNGGKDNVTVVLARYRFPQGN